MRYNKQLDHLILAVHYATRGKKRRAAKSLQRVLKDDPRETKRVLASLAESQSKAFQRDEDEKRRRGSRFVGEAATDDYMETASQRRKRKEKRERKKLKRRARINIRAL